MILDAIATKTRLRVAAQKQQTSLAAVKAAAEQLPVSGFPFARALRQTDVAMICEIKKASPSKGVIVTDFPYRQIARDYAAAGADALSVLTEPDFFQGNDCYLQEIAAETPLPRLRKDFIIDPYQIYQARLLGASAVLLIVALLETSQLRVYRELAESLGLSALVETHDAAEVARALDAGASIVGINNRNLQTFTVDTATALRLRSLVPADKIVIAESGLRTAADIAALRAAHIDAALIGETLMRASDKQKALAALRGRDA